MLDDLEISAGLLQKWLAGTQPPQILDVRELAEWQQTGILDGSACWPVGQLTAETAAELLTRERPVVAVCRSGVRSLAAVKVLRAAGYRAFSLAGGVAGWLAAGFATVRFPN